MIAQFNEEFIKFQTFSLPRVYELNTINVEFALTNHVTAQKSECPRIIILCEETKLPEDADIDAYLVLDQCGAGQVIPWVLGDKNVADGYIQSLFFQIPIGSLGFVNVFQFFLQMNPAEAELTARGRIYYDI